MTTEPRCTFALVRNLADLENASEMLTEYLSILRLSHSPARAEPVMGIWIDEQGVANMPCMLELRMPSGARREARILEATGVSGVWMLCWLEAPARTTSRAALLEALLEACGHQPQDASPGHFIPVFATDESDETAEAEMQLLQTLYPGLILAPRHHAPLSGCLHAPSEHALETGVAH